MKKRVLALFLCLIMTFCMACPSAFADVEGDLMPNHTHDWKPCSIGGFTGEIQGITVGVEVTQCSDCGWYKHTCNFFGYKLNYYSIVGFTNLGGELATWVANNVYNILGKNASAKKYETGGGSAGTGGVGRRPSGYSENNTPDVTQAGQIHFYAPVTGWTRTIYSGYGSRFWAKDKITELEVPSANASGTVFPSNFSSATGAIVVCAFTAPVSGTYSVLPGKTVGEYRYVNSNTWKTLVYTTTNNTGAYAKGDSAWLVCLNNSVDPTRYNSFDVKGYGVDIYVTPLTSTLKQTNNITINNNTWNGNIYQDNSTNLTYIYPQYTTINENNETVTNISENPIIYNNETKQYYTYDTVTNNYYYITYEAPTPSPSPSPDPTPTPEPGEDTGDTSGIMKILQEIKAVLVNGFAGITEKLQNIGVDGSTPETAKPGSSSGNKGQSWWEKLLGKIGDAIVDGLLGAISAVLKLIFKLFTTILGWIIWLVSQVLTLFPFLPPGLGALLIGGVVVCFIIGLIKFIRG